MLYRYIWGLLAGLLVPLSLGAQTASPGPADSVTHDYTLSGVVVTGTQTPRLLKKLPIMTQVITQRDLQRINPRSAADALQMSIPGVNVTMHGAQYRVTIQGMSGDYILFLVDGEKITSEGNGVVDLNRIDMSTIERIEVIRGSASALYGSNAIGGVVNFITRQGQRPLQANASMDISSEGVTRYALGVQVRRQEFSSSTSLSYTHQDPYSINIPQRDGSVDVTSARGQKTKTLGQTLRYRTLDSRSEVYAYLRYSFRDQDELLVTRRNHYTTHSLGGRLYHAFDSQHNVRLDYTNELYDRSDWFVPTRDYSPVFLQTAHTMRLQYNYGEEGVTKLFANVGGEGYHEALQGNRFEDYRSSYRAELYSGYLQAEYRPSERLSLVGGLRYDHHSRFGGRLSPRLSALYSIGDLRLRASYSEGFRSPSLKELYMDWDHLGMFFIKGNTSLRPEVSRMISLSPEYQTRELNVTILASYNIIQDRISLVEQSNTDQRYENRPGTSKLLNVQTSVRWRMPWGLNLNADYAYLNTIDRIRTKSGIALPFASTRPHNFTATLSYDKRVGDGTISASYTLRGASSVTTAQYSADADDYTPVVHQAFVLSRLAVTALWRSRLRISLGVDNLFDYLPESVNVTGSISPGRTYFSTLALTF